MPRVGQCRLNPAGVIALNRKLKEGRWASVDAFCTEAGVPRSTYYELIGREKWFEHATIQDKLTAFGIDEVGQPHLCEFKPLNAEPVITSGHIPINFPMQPTSFIGRETDKAAVKRLIAESQMLTLSGAGGSGKTRLALVVASEILNEFPDGVRWVELAALSEPDLVARALLSALGLREELNRQGTETAAAYLKSRSLLLILDNCEHLLAACAQLAATLARECPQVKILATSREPLRIQGETVWHVPSMLLPDEISIHTPEKEVVGTLESYDAIRLFVERARSVRPDFALSAQNGPWIVEICRRLDGIPLAIELAAARVRSFGVEDIRARLDGRFKLLTSDSHTSISRHQTLTALIKWSYDLLDDKEKLLLPRLSVFSGGWTLDAAEQVCSTDEIPLEEVCTVLASLADKSLVVFDEHSGGGRYRLLETVRQFTEDKLNVSGESADLRQKHCEFFLTLAITAEGGMEGDAQSEWLKRLEADYENYRAALTWSLSSSVTICSLQLCGALRLFWDTRGYYSEGRAWCDRAIAKPMGSEDAIVRGMALNTAGVLANSQGNHNAARAYHAESLVINRETGNKRGIVASLTGLGVAANRQGDFASARANYEEGLTISRETGNLWDVGRLLLYLGNVDEHSGDFTNAKSRYEESLSIRRRIGDQIGIAYSLLNLGNIDDCCGEFISARAHYEDSLARFRENGDRAGIADCALYVGNAYLYMGDYASANELYEESTSIYKDIGNRRGQSHSISNLGTLSLCAGNYETARAYYEESLAIRQDIGDRRGAAGSLVNLGNVLLSRGDFTRASILYEESLSLFEQIGDLAGVAWSHYFLGNAAYEHGDRASARAHHNESTSIYLQNNDRWSLSRSFDTLAVIAFRDNDLTRAIQLWAKTESLLQQMGAQLLPCERLSNANEVANAQEMIGETAFSAAWAAGRALTLEQAVELALEKPKE